MIKKLIYIIIIAVNLIALTVKSEDIEPKRFNLSLPIMAEKNLITHLIVKIPENFKPLQTVNAMSSGSAEFIPIQDKDPYKWTEIITTAAYPGKSINAYEFVNDLKDSIIRSAMKTKIIEHRTKIVDNYKVATLIMSYDFNGRKELVFARYYSGLYDCTGLQYSIVLNNNMTQAQALQKIEGFVNNPKYVEVLKMKR